MNRAPEDPRFRLIAPLGRGGTAEVVSVHVNDLHRPAALKYCLDDGSSDPNEFLKLVKREHALIGVLSYPGLVRPLEPPHARPGYILLELCGGPTLDRLGRVDDLPTALSILSAIACNLEFLRAQDIIHGDLKPQNVFLPISWQSLASDALFYTKLSDFSLGRRGAEPENARAGLGTVGYMAPEVLAQTTTSHQSDLFAFGLIAYNLLTGVHPFLNKGSDPVKVNSRIHEETVPSVGELRPDLADSLLARLVDRLLAKNPAARPSTAFEVCVLLEEAGSAYPFRRAIRPRHLIRHTESYEANRERLLVLSDGERQQLDDCTGMSIELLTLLTDANFASNNLFYESGQFHFSAGVYWPSRLRRRALAGFSSGSPARKRRLVRNAVDCSQSPAANSDRPILRLLPHLLRPATVRRLSLRPAKDAERNENHAPAAVLYLQSGDLPSAERCAYQAATLLSRDSHWKPAVQLIDRVIDFARLSNRRGEVVQLELQRATILKDSGDTNAAEAALQELIAHFEDRPPETTLGIVYNKLGDLYKMRSDFERGLASLTKALAIFEQLGNELEYSHTCNNLGNSYWQVGELDKSLAYYRRALRVQRRLGVVKDIASTLSNIGSVFCVRGKFRRGVFMLDESLRLKRELGHAGEIARTLNNLGYAYHILGDNLKALDFLHESLGLNRRIGSRKEIMFNLENLTAIMILAGQLRQSIEFLREGLELSGQLEDGAHEIAFSTGMGTVLMRLGRLGEARQMLEGVSERLQVTDDPMAGALHALARAQLSLLINNREEAIRFSSESLETASKHKDAMGQLRALLMLARLEDSVERCAQANRVISEIHFERMRTALAFNRSERFLHDGDPREAMNAIADHLADPLGIEEDIDGPMFCLVAAVCLMDNGRAGEAAPYLQRAQDQAQASHLAPELMTCGLLLGRLAVERGDFEDAYGNYKRAFQVAKQISGSLGQESDRTNFQQQRHVRQIVNEIKRLGLILGQKERAGASPARS
ncbi:MAG: tetratricopeptide repeat protein [candidate division Zixibacteria bacterium]|nr:tetratricopeptide repeat protein [candidate division Zixibacteria bacterium]